MLSEGSGLRHRNRSLHHGSQVEICKSYPRRKREILIRRDTFPLRYALVIRSTSSGCAGCKFPTTFSMGN